MRCFLVKIPSYAGVEDVWNPYGDDGGHVSVDGEGGGDGLEKYVGEAESEAYAEVQSHASFRFFGGEGDAYQGQDEGCKGHGDAFVVLNLKLFGISEASLFLSVDVLAELGACHHLVLVFHHDEVFRFHVEGGIQLFAFGDALSHAVDVANHVVFHRPSVHLCGVVLDAFGREV